MWVLQRFHEVCSFKYTLMMYYCAQLTSDCLALHDNQEETEKLALMKTEITALFISIYQTRH